MNTENKFYQSIAGLSLVTGILLLIPLIAMQFTEEVNWSLSDFIFMGSIIFGTGIAYKLMTRKSGKITYQIALGTALAAAFLLVWVNGAVGIIGNEGNLANLMYFWVIAVGIIGAIISRLKPYGMARTMFLTAGAQSLVPVIALIVWPPKVISWGAAGVFGVFTLNAFFILLLVVSALLFRHAAQEDSPQPEE